jgi:TonB family protein
MRAPANAKAPARRPISRLVAGSAILALGGAFAALTFLAQRSELGVGAPPPAAATRTGAPGDGPELADTPTRSSAVQEPVAQIAVPAPASPRDDAVRFPDGDLFALLRVAPEYPLAALREAREAVVRLSFTITKFGTVTDVVVVESSDPLFDASAALSVERWKYMPRVVNGERVDVPGVQTVIRFQMAAPAEEKRSAAPRAAPEPPPDRPPLKELLAEAWDCAAVRNLLCAQQVLDTVSAAYELTAWERREVLSFYGYIHTQYGDFERAIATFREAAGDDPASDVWVTVMHLYFTRQQYQLALDTGVRYLAAVERSGRPARGGFVEPFVEKLKQLGIRPTTTGPVF